VLLWTLEQAKRDKSMPARRPAWATAYTAPANAMKTAAHPDPAVGCPSVDTPTCAV